MCVPSCLHLSFALPPDSSSHPQASLERISSSPLSSVSSPTPGRLSTLILRRSQRRKTYKKTHPRPPSLLSSSDSAAVRSAPSTPSTVLTSLQNSHLVQRLAGPPWRLLVYLARANARTRRMGSKLRGRHLGDRDAGTRTSPPSSTIITDLSFLAALFPRLRPRTRLLRRFRVSCDHGGSSFSLPGRTVAQTPLERRGLDTGML
jgi:hypothetical protein